MYKWGVDYHLPLFYPDAGFANILYLLRVRASLFYDDTRRRTFTAMEISLRQASVQPALKLILIQNGGMKQTRLLGYATAT